MITAAQIREARRLLRRSSAAVAMRSGVQFALVLKAQVDAEIGAVGFGALQAIERALVRSGVEFTPTSVHLRKTGS